jgi:hypothetical protein
VDGFSKWELLECCGLGNSILSDDEMHAHNDEFLDVAIPSVVIAIGA